MRAQDVVKILAALVVAVSASPISTTRHVVHESRSAPPSDWSKQGRLHATSAIPVRIGLAQRNLHRVDEFIDQVSHPFSNYYGKHWSAAQVAETFSPSPETVFAVKSWLHGFGIEPNRIRTSKSRNWIEFNATVGEAESLLKAEYHMYNHHAGHKHVACEEYSIPTHLMDHIDIITPTVHFDKKIGAPRRVQTHERLPDPLSNLNRRDVQTSSGILGSASDASNPKQGNEVKNALMTLDNCDTMITPPCLQALYNAPPGKKAGKNNTLGIVEFTPQAFLQSDMDMWFKEFAPDVKQKTPNTNLIDGAIVQNTSESFSVNGESSLDLQYAMALIAPQQVTLYQVGDTVESGSFNNFLDAIDGSYCTFEGGGSKDSNVDGQYPDPQPGGFQGALNCGGSTSTNYSSNEADLTSKYVQRQCMEYMKLGLQGVSILYSSGDSGVAGNGGTCIDPQTGAFNNGSTGKFNPSFPGTCPYVTSVGATQVLNGSSVRAPESACEKVIFSGGGFSNVFPMASYQKNTMSSFFAQNKIPYGAERFNNSQTVRGYPDVSANGANYVVAVDGKFSLTFGTSASSPTFASLVNMINEERLAVGKGPVGFLNPTLYANPQVLNDITTGGNRGCGTPGFNSTKGWDPVTGLGTPNYPKMLKLFMSLP
ncbi:Aorsin [Lachnellula subtilissima]|uniref:tripeptidyl-peptidase II n=1 Tax=Lachnellula subtilissima TaxID=602034 RepID=A0A8H8UF25_9HELO|nr:Aorsin [Lachnellula subtilissima]